MPRVDDAEHRAAPYRVHALASDFELLDVWEYPIRARPPHDLAYFVAFMHRVVGEVVTSSGAAGLLFRVRAAMGRAFGWNDEPFTLVYELENEVLLQTKNRTVHGLLHLAWVDKGDGTHVPRMAVYAKPRGWLGRCYMALISPFRHLVVYPTLMRKTGSAWAATHATIGVS